MILSASNMAANALAGKRRLVLKVGSALLVDPERRTIRQDWLASVCADIHLLRQQGMEVIVVSSGAISLARRQTDRTNVRLRLDEKQALASIGQVGLAQAWRDAVARHGLLTAQLLLTPDDTEDRKRHLNARATLEAILKLGAIPVINENDAIATEEIRFGDNDRLAARITQMIGADLLILLSDIDGLYTADPRHNPAAEHLSLIPCLNESIMAMGGEPPPGYSSGGMRTKLLAAQIATRAGADMLIVRGTGLHPIICLQHGMRHTRFLATNNIPAARKGWIATMLHTRGELSLDEGAVAALQNGASLLPAGVTRVEGTFQRGDVIVLKGPDGTLIGQGLSEYDDKEARLLLGHHSTETENILGHQGPSLLIHRDNLALIPSHSTVDQALP